MRLWQHCHNRKNWFFANSQAGANASANLYSIIETAKANGLNPYEYLRKIFKELPNAQSVEGIEKLLPWELSATELTSQAGGWFSAYENCDRHRNINDPQKSVDFLWRLRKNSRLIINRY